MKRYFFSFLAKLFTSMSPRLYMRLSYLHNRGRLPNLRKPKNISEIIISTMDSGKVKEYAPYVDKIRARDILENWGYKNHLPKIYGQWSDPRLIDFSSLPNSFALKTNHGCGGHYICRDRKNLDVNKAIKVIENALGQRFGAVEQQYNLIEPKVYCEEFLDDGLGELPIDYKFMCLNGEVKCLLIVTERKNASYKLITYDMDWNKLDYVVPKYKTDLEMKKPKNFNVMLRIATEIAQKFLFVRVDLYDLGDRVIIGELTFTPQGGIMSYFSNDAIEKMSEPYSFL